MVTEPDDFVHTLFLELTWILNFRPSWTWGEHLTNVLLSRNSFSTMVKIKNWGYTYFNNDKKLRVSIYIELTSSEFVFQF